MNCQHINTRLNIENRRKYEQKKKNNNSIIDSVIFNYYYVEIINETSFNYRKKTYNWDENKEYKNMILDRK